MAVRKRKMSEVEMAFVIDKLENLGPGASFRDANWSIWVKGTGKFWFYSDMAGSVRMMGSEEVVRTYGFAGVRTDGTVVSEPLSPAEVGRELNDDETEQQRSTVFAESLDVGSTVVGRGQCIWVKSGSWDWFHQLPGGGIKVLTEEKMIRTYGPFANRTDGKVNIALSR